MDVTTSARQSTTAAARIRLVFFAFALRFCILFSKEAQKEVDRQSQYRDQKASRHGHGRIVGGDPAVDRNAQSAGSDEGCDTREGDGHGHHASDPGHDYRHGKGQPDLKEDLHPGAPHSLCRLQDGRIDIGHSRVRIAHHREKRIDGERDHRRRVSHAGERDQESQHGDGRDRV